MFTSFSDFAFTFVRCLRVFFSQIGVFFRHISVLAVKLLTNVHIHISKLLRHKTICFMTYKLPHVSDN